MFHGMMPWHIVNDCRLKQSGNMLQEQESKRHIHGAMKQLKKEDQKQILGKELFQVLIHHGMDLTMQHLLNHFNQMHMGCMIWLEMFGNGAQTGTEMITIK